ncbi:hypothetical protein HDU79_009792 [Rhizoclosmatium sp. JEL0117]|nr:hypothetical protein HDU79_009792 [Rhizoclosmatium sp. JEL0117]
MSPTTSLVATALIGSLLYNSKTDKDAPTYALDTDKTKSQPSPPEEEFPWPEVSIKTIDWTSFTILTVTPLLALFGMMYVPLQAKTFWFSVFYYFFTGMGITAGYHRYWSHRSYDATRVWEFLLLAAGTGAMEGSVKWWSHGHRIHHRFTDTDKDPYNAKRGFLWSHIGWMVIKEEKKVKVDVSDLNKDPWIRFQHKHYLELAVSMAFIFPTLVAGLLWGDWLGGFFYAGVTRLVCLHHSTFCINSLAHYYGEHTYDDRRTPRDNVITALITFGEGYHNFHHEFPADYRNAIEAVQYDPTKWLIWTASLFGLTYNLKMFPANEILKGKVTMQEKKIAEIRKTLTYGVPLEDLPSMTHEQVKERIAETGKQLMIISGIVYDVTDFMDDHPGGKGFLKVSVGRDVTASFNGGVYNHANAARNLMTSMRYAILVGETPASETATLE